MIKEIIGTGRTVESAIADGANQLGIDASRAQYEIIEAPKKGFLGFGEAPAKVRVFIEIGPEQTALEYVTNVTKAMGLRYCNVQIARELNSEGGKIIRLTGEDSGVLIGRHGDTLDALQYLANLALNNKLEQEGKESEKVTLDIEGYRARREETLRILAKRTAEKVKKYHKNIALDPMTPYERRIIHSALQNDSEVMTASVGSDENRKVVIHYVGKVQKPRKNNKEDAEVSEEVSATEE